MDPAAPRLVPRPRWGVGIAALAWVLLGIMAWWLRDSRDPTGVDTAVRNWLFDHVGTVLTPVTLGLSEPVLTIGICVVVILGAAIGRRWDLAALGVLGPTAGLLLESHVLKPEINRLYGAVEVATGGAIKAGYAFPSGHETGLGSALMLLLIPLLASRRPRSVKITAVLAAVVWGVLGAAGLVRNDYHYFTDTLGGICLSVGLMLTVALLIDQVRARFSSPAGRVRPRTAPAA